MKLLDKRIAKNGNEASESILYKETEENIKR